MRITMLNVPIDAITRAEARACISSFLDEEKSHLITTPNPEMLVASHRDPEFRRVLRSADLAVPDGTGLVIMSRLMGGRIPERITGVDLVFDIADLAAKKGRSVFLLGGDPGAAQAAAETLRARYPGLMVVGAERGGPITFDGQGTPRIDPAVVERIHAARPDVLFVAFGHGKQERWLAENLAGLPSVRIGIGVGGAFEFVSGMVKRAPKFVRMIGFEWLWRLIGQPRRIRRILNAVLVFPYLVVRGRNDRLTA